MAQTTLVEMQMSEGQRLIDRLHQEDIDVTAAAWVKEGESGDWYLYLATPLVSENDGTLPAYRRVNTVIREMQKEGFGLDPFEIKLIGPHDPIAKDIVAHRASRPSGPPRWFAGSRLGELAVEQAWIYPRPPTPEEAAGMRLWDCGGLELRPGVGPRGHCRSIVIDLEKQIALQGSDKQYPGIVENATPLQQSQAEVTWAEGGQVQIVATGIGPARQQRWVWSQPRLVWDQGGCPPDRVLQAILTALGDSPRPVRPA